MVEIKTQVRKKINEKIRTLIEHIVATGRAGLTEVVVVVEAVVKVESAVIKEDPETSQETDDRDVSYFQFSYIYFFMNKIKLN